MRITASFLLSLALSLPAMADPGDAIDLSESVAAPLAAPLQFRLQASRETLQVMPGLQAEKYASQMGDISDFAVAANGTLYAADQKTGRIYVIEDRGRDGRADLRRVLPVNFDRPGGLLLADGLLYIADQKAIWVWDPAEKTAREFVSLRNIQGAVRRPLAADEAHILIAISDSVGQTKIIQINKETAKAQLRSQGPGPVQDMLLAGPTLWVGAADHIIPVRGETYAWDQGQTLEPGAQISALLIPGQAAGHPVSFDPWAQDILIAQSGRGKLSKQSSGGLNVLRVSTVMGEIGDTAEVWLDGFLSEHRRTAWGRPGTMRLDARGLFLSDPQNGTIWRISSAAEGSAGPGPETGDIKIYEPSDDELAELLKQARATPNRTAPKTLPLGGSSIEKSDLKGSQIAQGSTLETGSGILDEWEAAQADKEKTDEPD